MLKSRKLKFSSISLPSSAILSALTICPICLGSTILGVAGLSGLASQMYWIVPLRPYFFVLAFLLLGVSFYKAYKPKRKTEDNCHSCELEGKSRIKQKIYVPVVALFVASLFLISYYPRLIFG